MSDPSLSAHAEGGWWGGFRRAHLHDYNPAATRFWLALAVTGAMALAFAGTRIAQLPASEWWQILGWTGFVAIAAAFPIPFPRGKPPIATGDVVIFRLLDLYGAAGGVLAVVLEGIMGA